MSKSGPPPEVYPYPHDYGHHPHHHGGPYHGGPQYGAPPHQGPTYHNTYAPVTSQANSQSTNVVLNMGGNDNNKSGALNRRGWSTQICGCMEDCGGCLCTCMFMPCMMCMLASRMDECFLLPYLVPQALMAMRVKLRESNRIQGSILMDCICTSCCPMLSLCQMKRELDNIDNRKPGTEL